VALGGKVSPTIPWVSYGLFGAAASDPVGPYPTSTGQGTAPTGTTDGTGYYDAYFYDVSQAVSTIGYFYSF
jgi:hypothetical protein